MNKEDELGPLGKALVCFIFGVIPGCLFVSLVFIAGAIYGGQNLCDDAVKHHVAEYYLKPDNKVGWRWLK